MDCEAFLPFPLLSDHWLTDPEDSVMVALSLASSHRLRFGFFLPMETVLSQEEAVVPPSVDPQ